MRAITRAQPFCLLTNPTNIFLKAFAVADAFFIFTSNCKSMRTLINIFFTTLFVLLLAHIMPGVEVNSFFIALIVALVLGLLNIFVKPLLILFTLPATIFTLGLFLLVINAVIILLCDELVDGFEVVGFWRALLFSLVLSFCQSLVSSGTSEKKRQE